MLIGGGGRISQECAHSALLNHPLGFVGRGKILAQMLWPGMEARLRRSNGQLEGPSVEAMDADGSFIDRNGNYRQATLNRLRFGQDGAVIEGAYTSDFDSDISDHTLLGADGPVAPVRTLNSGDVTDPKGGSTATKLVYPAVASVNERSFAYADFGSNQAVVGQSIWLRGASGGEQVYLWTIDQAESVVSTILCILTTSWQKFTVGGTTQRWVLLGVDLRAFTGHTAKSAQTIYAWGKCIQNQFAFGTGTVDGDDPITVAADDHRHDNTGEVICKAAQGTVLIGVVPGADAARFAGNVFLLVTATASQSNRADLFIDATTDSYRFLVKSGGTTVADLNSSGGTVPVRRRKNVVVVWWDTNNFGLTIDGINEGTDGGGAAPAAFNADLFIGQYLAGTGLFFGNLVHGVIIEPVLSVRQIENATAVVRKAA